MRKTFRRTRSLIVVAALGGAVGLVMAQDDDAPQYPQYVQYPEGAPPVTPALDAAPVLLAPDQMDQLLAPIALYPDPLLSLIFPAATYPQDIVAAEQWLSSAPTPTETNIDAQNWDGSIKALVHYPTVLKMMSDQIDWTQALGAAFLNQQADVLASVQRLRAQARADGSLQDTQQAQVVADGNDLLIEPVDPNVIYVPTYNPEVVYTGAYPIDWGASYPIGIWCDNGFDWGGGYIVVGAGWYYGWHHPPDWDRNPPQWFRQHRGWAPHPQRWARAPRGAAPVLTSEVAARVHLGGARVQPGVVRGAPAREPSANIFDPVVNRGDVQRAVQRARPAAAPPVQRVQEAAPRQQPEYRPPPPAPVRAAPSGAFGGGSAADARAASARGQASRGRR
ncbi:MAG: DUF3300 domain-containing protein [Tepidisphaeraceae bacterium]|jgi:hypothetical protein